MAYQIAFDLYESATQQFLNNVVQAVRKTAPIPAAVTIGGSSTKGIDDFYDSTEQKIFYLCYDFIFLKFVSITLKLVLLEKSKDSEKEVKAEEKSEDAAMEVDAADVKEEGKATGEDGGKFSIFMIT